MPGARRRRRPRPLHDPRRDGPTERVVTAMQARELGRKGIVVGDRVARRRRRHRAAPTRLARIVRVEPRAIRAAAHRRRHRPRRAHHRRQRRPARRRDGAGRPRAAPAADRPLPRRGVRRRAWSRCWCLTKADLADPATVRDTTPRSTCRTSSTPRRDGTIDGLDALRERLPGRVSVLVGHSGVGKSTLVNALVPGPTRATGVVNDVTGRGRHTSSSAVALRAARRRGWVIDTPGVRSLRAGPRRPRPDHPRLPRPRAGHRRLPARLHPRRAGVRARRVGRAAARPARPDRRAWTRCAACCAPAPTAATDRPRRRPRAGGQDRWSSGCSSMRRVTSWGACAERSCWVRERSMPSS